MRNNQNKEKILKRALKKETKSVVGFFIRNFRFTYLIILAIILLGGYGLITLPREADPEVKIPFALVTTIYPQASPGDVEELVTSEIEEKVKNLDDLKRYNSTSGQGFSSVFVEFTADANLKDSLQKLRDVVSQARPSLPQEAKDPMVTEIRVSDMPIVNYSLVADIQEAELKKYADFIQKELESINGVSKVVIVGGLTREFQIIINPIKLANFNLTMGQVINAISRANFNLPAGNIEIDNFKYNVRIQGKLTDPQELNDLVVATYENSPVYLSDLALIKDTYQDRQTESKIGLANQPSQNTISLQVYKKTGGNIVNIVAQADEQIRQVQQSGRLPQEMSVEKTNDNAWFIEETLNRLGLSGLQTMILITILLFIVLGWRGALIASLSVPLAFLMAFIFLAGQKQSLNSIVLYSLVISLGLMVDNAIIIMEGISEYMIYHKKTARQAALLAVWNFKWPIVSGTLTTVAAFFPMLLVSGILGEFFSFIPKTISATLLSSLFVALIIVPTLSSRFIKKMRRFDYHTQKGFLKKIQPFLCVHCLDKLKAQYTRLMDYLLVSKKRRRIVLAAAWLAFFIAIAVPAAGLMKIEMFSAIDFDMFLVNIKLPPGSSLDLTRSITQQAERIVAQTPELKSYVTNLGAFTSWTSFEGSSNGSHLATITVNLTPRKERKIKSMDIAAQMRPRLEAIQGARVRLEEASAGPPSGAPIEARIFGNDLTQLSNTAEQLMNILKNIPGTINVKDSLEESSGEFTFKINKQQADFYGLDTAAIASAVRQVIYGAKASTVNIKGQDIDIIVKYDKDQFSNIEDLKNLLIFTPQGQAVPLKQLTSLSLEPSPLAISHRDGKKIVAITANLEQGANLQKVLKEFDQKRALLSIPDEVTIEVGGEIEEITQSYQETFLSMIVALILIAFILVLQFHSFRQPLIILFTLPLATIGVIFGLNILRMPFSFPVFLGIVALAGIAVNDAIVLIDRVNKNLKAGLAMTQGLIEAGVARMQPIFLTSITTIAGVFPLIFADELWRGFSITLIFGLIFSTSLTLIIIPIFYSEITRKKRFTRNVIMDR